MKTVMFFQKPVPEPTVSLFGVVTTTISAIWVLNKLVSLVRFLSSPSQKPGSEQLYQLNKCHCQLWHSNCNNEVNVGWHRNDDIRWNQNFEIKKAFISVEKCVEQLSWSGYPTAVSAVKILQDAIIALKLNVYPTESDLVEIARKEEHLFVADSLKDAWPLLAPKKVPPGRRFVELFCENLDEKKDNFCKMAEENHSLLEFLQYILIVGTSSSQKLTTIIEKKLYTRKDLTELKGALQITANFLKQKSEQFDIETNLSSAFDTLEKEGIKRIVAIDTEMVGAGVKGEINMLGRVSLVNQVGCIYDKYVTPVQPVTDYRTFVSGITPEVLTQAVAFNIIRWEVRDLIRNCILVGHDLEKDLAVLGLTHPAKNIRDTAFYVHFRRVPHEKPSLAYLARSLLGRDIQKGEHDSVEDAQAVMDIYLWSKKLWEFQEEKCPEINAYKGCPRKN